MFGIENIFVSEVPHQEVKVSAYLNMAADMTHNFTDGLAIGMLFLDHTFLVYKLLYNGRALEKIKLCK